MTIARHHGGCHCGGVRYTAELDLAAPALAINVRTLDDVDVSTLTLKQFDGKRA